MKDIRVTQDFNGGAIFEVAPGLARAETVPMKVGIPCLICGKVLETDMGSYCLYPYICDECKYFELADPEIYRSGYDLPEKTCPHCGHKLRGEGQNIPFETFLGFKGDKVPDIDLNFSGEYQPTAHDFTKVMFGVDNVYRAGTIGTVAQKTAYGYAKGFFEDLNKLDNVRKAELQRISMGCEGVKRTTGQHFP